MFPFVAASALMPSLLLIWYFHARDLNKEPARVLWATFGLGVASVIPVLMVAMPLAMLVAQAPLAWRGVLDAVFSAALPEEFFKFLVVVFYCSRHREFDEPMDGIVYGAVASLGFATFENVMYVAGGGLGNALFRAFTAVPGHAFMGAIMGWHVGQARFGPPAERRRNLWRAYFIPVLLHAGYDAPILSLKNNPHSTLVGVSLLLSLAVLIFEWRWTVRLVRRLRAEQIAVITTQASAALVVGADSAVVIGSVTTSVEVQQAHPAPPVNPAGGGVLAVVWLILGGILASIGGLVTLATIIGVAMDPRHQLRGELASVVLGVAFLGVLPLGLGLWLFRLGLRRWRRPKDA